MFKTIALLIFLAVYGEVGFCLFKCKNASDYSYYLSRPFGKEMDMKKGIIVRVALLFLGAVMFLLIF